MYRNYENKKTITREEYMALPDEEKKNYELLDEDSDVEDELDDDVDDWEEDEEEFDEDEE